MPASSDMRASLRLSRQLPLQRSGTLVTARPDEQLAPNRPICRRWSPYMAMRLRSEASRTGTDCWRTSFMGGSCSLAAGVSIGDPHPAGLSHLILGRPFDCRPRAAGDPMTIGGEV